jgi:hypothetical protein
MMINKKLLAVVAATLIVVATTSTITYAAGADAPKNGWGKATSGIAKDDGRTFGEHASNPDPTNDDPHDTPRIGISNLAKQVTGSHNPSDLGDAVAGQLP